ncbi:MAG TPA: GNAT family N-acetyltransferase [Stenotrophomonas sp.]|jgi:predicted GNAT family acetyltransferase
MTVTDQTPAEPEIRHDPAQGRFTTQVDGHEAELVYELREPVLRIVHTGVPQAIGGRGVAGRLLQSALDFARSRGYKVRPDCAYAAQYFERHPELDALRG